MIDLGTPAAKAARPPKKIKTIKGISAFHYMKAEDQGVRVWHVANVGVGRLISWATIKKHHNNRTVVDPCVPAAVDPARLATPETAIPSNQFVPKLHRSHRNVKKKKKERIMRRDAKRRTREHNYKKQVEEIISRVEIVDGFKCQWCSRPMKSVERARRFLKSQIQKWSNGVRRPIKSAERARRF